MTTPTIHDYRPLYGRTSLKTCYRWGGVAAVRCEIRGRRVYRLLGKMCSSRWRDRLA